MTQLTSPERHVAVPTPQAIVIAIISRLILIRAAHHPLRMEQ